MKGLFKAMLLLCLAFIFCADFYVVYTCRGIGVTSNANVNCSDCVIAGNYRLHNNWLQVIRLINTAINERRNRMVFLFIGWVLGIKLFDWLFNEKE